MDLIKHNTDADDVTLSGDYLKVPVIIDSQGTQLNYNTIIECYQQRPDGVVVDMMPYMDNPATPDIIEKANALYLRQSGYQNGEYKYYYITDSNGKYVLRVTFDSEGKLIKVNGDDYPSVS
jgi:hypothetical protein